MKLKLCLVIFISFALANLSVCHGKLPTNVAKFGIEMRLNHFDSTNAEKWNMTYLANDEFFLTGGPIFILLGLSQDFLVKGQLYNLARENNGCLFSIPKRFYGPEFPKKYLAKVEYLNVNQTIEDLASFVSYLKASNPEMKESKVIFAGDGTQGSHIVWLKQIYPNIFDAAWVYNAPILAQMELPDLSEALTDYIRKIGGKKCVKNIGKGMIQLKNLLRNGQSEKVRELFHLCRYFKAFNASNEIDVLTFFDTIQFHWSMKDAQRIENSCSLISKYRVSAEGIANDVLTASYSSSCWSPSFEAAVSEFSEPDTSMRVYQQYHEFCSEFGWWPISKSSIFAMNIPTDYYAKFCSAIFGEKYTETNMRNQIDQFNEKFNTFNPNVTNVFFTHSEYDQLRSVTHETSIPIPDIEVNIFDESKPTGSIGLKQAREYISELITAIFKKPKA